MTLDRQVCDRARRSRDPRFDGLFYIGVISTGIYCRPVCPARAPKDENVRYFPTAAAAEAAGLRPCLRCRPEASPGTPAWGGTSALVARGLRLIGDGALDDEGVDRLADRLGVTARHLRRLFLQHVGATPLQIALTRRVHFAKQLLDETHLACSEVALASGFRSTRRFNSQIRRTYSRTPTELRQRALARPRRSTASIGALGASPGARPPQQPYRFRLTYRPPYDRHSVVSFLAARSTPGVESVTGSCYRRTIAIDGTSGSFAARFSESTPSVDLEVRFPAPGVLFGIVEQVRRMLDLDADPLVIAEHLGADPLLRDPLRHHPGIRTPGAWDGFELAVRAIVGQQISVRGATTIAGRIAAMFGTKIDAGDDLTRLFPSAAQLADAALERAGVVRVRARAIRTLARRVMDGSIRLGAGADPAALMTIPGIGCWTAGYIAMRAFGDPDAFPSGDLVLRRAAGVVRARDLDARAQLWRPWRAYAAVLLWRAAGDGRTTTRGITNGLPPGRSRRDGARLAASDIAGPGAG